MAAGSTKRKHRRLSAGEVNRALVASAALAAILLLALFVTAGSYVTADRQTKNAVTKIAPLSASTGGEAAHRVASIVVETDKKGRCEGTPFRQPNRPIVSSNADSGAIFVTAFLV